VDRTLLWDQLLKLGATVATVNVIKKLYKGTIYNIHWEGFQSGDLEASRGVRQGCPMSPTLFLAYINDLGMRLKDSGLGYSFGQTRIPCLLFADDVVLISEDPGGGAFKLSWTSAQSLPLTSSWSFVRTNQRLWL